MAFGIGIFSNIPDVAFVVIHLFTFLAGIYFATKAKGNTKVMGAFALYGFTGLMYALVHLGSIDGYFTHVIETVLVFVAIILIGLSWGK